MSELGNYKWQHPHEWLGEKIQKADETELKSVLVALLPKLDSDTIQDVFEREMDEDGYFHREGCPSFDGFGCNCNG